MRGAKPVEWTGEKLRILDQTELPREVYLELSSPEEVAEAIREMKVRGAPAIGVVAAYGFALGALKLKEKGAFALSELRRVKELLASTRPTARNLFWALERMMRAAEQASGPEEIVEEARNIERETRRADELIGENGAELVRDGMRILTHCNTGALATGGEGTALGVIKAAWRKGKKIFVLATETRPRLQGAKLTAWELLREGIPFSLITDGMAGYFMWRGEVDCVIVGADRIAANGDTANKIGTYTLAVLAREHGIPFWVAAPTSTIDLSLPSGRDIPIEERDPEEVLRVGSERIAPQGVSVKNPAFDITPADYISAIITEKGILRPPFAESIRKLLEAT